jgi:hypothetical protein
VAFLQQNNPTVDWDTFWCYNTYIDSNKQEHKMTVADLIALLQQLPQDADVWVSQNGGEYLGDMSGDVDVTDDRVTFLD